MSNNKKPKPGTGSSDARRLLRQSKQSLVEDLLEASRKLRAERASREEYQTRYRKTTNRKNELENTVRLRDEYVKKLQDRLNELKKTGGVFEEGIRTRLVEEPDGKKNAEILSARKTMGGVVVNALPFDQVFGDTDAEITDRPQPDFIRWGVRSGSRSVYIMELPPAVRSMRIATSGYGEDAKYSIRRLATPYVIMKLCFDENQVDRVSGEIFYRSRPIEDADSELYWCNLLNVSPNEYGQTAWFCTQYLHHEKHDGTIWGQLDAVQNHLWGAGFNRSSDEHEGASCFSMYEDNHEDARVRDFDAWEEASLVDPMFVCNEIDWIPVPKKGLGKINPDNVISSQITVRELIEHGLGSTYGKGAESRSWHSYNRVLGAIRTKGRRI